MGTTKPTTTGRKTTTTATGKSKSKANAKPKVKKRLGRKAVSKKTRKFECVWAGCGESFPTQYSLKRHYKRHRGDRPHPCTVQGCNARFAEKSTLQRHLQMHSGLRPFQCKYEGCGRRYADRLTCQKHEAKHKNQTFPKKTSPKKKKAKIISSRVPAVVGLPPLLSGTSSESSSVASCNGSSGSGGSGGEGDGRSSPVAPKKAAASPSFQPPKIEGSSLPVIPVPLPPPDNNNEIFSNADFHLHKSTPLF
jgi:hypothetical protein